MRTIAYVDGYNFYHGRLKHSPYKWLDLRSFLAELIRIQNPASELIGVKFFTANIKARMSQSLEDCAHWTRHYIRDEELAAHLLPERVGTRKKPVTKPEHW